MKQQLEIEKKDAPGDGLDLPQLMAHIRAEAEKRKRTAPAFSPIPLAEISQTTSPVQGSLPELKLQPDLPRRERYELNDLLGFHDEAFVLNAYKVILKREPDDAGFADYLTKLRSGHYNKIDIIRSLRFSPEGQRVNVSIEGLTWLVNLRRIYRVPVVGYLLQLVVAIVRLPVLIANHRRLESHTAAQLERVATHVNEAVAQLTETEHRHSENNRRLFMTNQGQLEALRNALRLQIESVVNEQEKTNREQHLLKTDLIARLDQTDARAAEHASFQERQHAELEGLKLDLEKRIDNLIDHLQSVRLNVVQQEKRLTQMGDAPRARSSHKPSVKAEEDLLLDALYCSLEDVLRGTPDEIKEQVKVYVPVLKNAGITSDILDVGCGRGELLEVLRGAGLGARGIDQSPIQVERCQSLSLDVVEAEALSYLRSLPNESLSAVTALHFAEHLRFETMVKFIDEAVRTLKPGGLLIMETPNPENLLVGSCNFYLDPTHKHPIPIPTMELLVEARGFIRQETMRLHPVSSAKIEVKDQLTSHLNHYLYGPMNYAIVARKPNAESSPET
ncbi:MAG TPA: methyltransferase domain-containing protein [Pyrinomonadaceae bacterium]|nr:methyltransferase domain-containing protein [Pyrinomonadaceae bacterium]